MDNILARPRRALDDAIQRVAPMLGVLPMKVDEQLQAYANMTPGDFDALAQDYGMERTLDYIEHMERLRRPPGG